MPQTAQTPNIFGVNQIKEDEMGIQSFGREICTKETTWTI
jgi:hypothetical protein